MYKTVKPTRFTLSLDNMSKKMRKKKTAIVSEALEMYIDYQDIKLVQKRLNDPDSYSLTPEELEKELVI